ncbi:hypothetical protein L9F63_018601, partial [Diploptera punctata]
CEEMSLIDSSLLTDPVVIIIGLLVGLCLYFEYRFSYWRKRGVPCVKPSFIFGNFKEVLFQKVCVGEFFQNMYNKGEGKPFVGIYVFGSPALVIRDPELIKTVLVKDFNIFFDRKVMSNEKSDPLSKNLFLLKGAQWRYLRYKMTPTFTALRLKQMFPLMQKTATQFGDCLQNIVNSKKSTEMKETAAKYATDVITTCAFGIESNCLSDPKAEFREFGRQIFDFTVYRSFEFMSMFMLPLAVKYLHVQFLSKHATEFLRKAFWETIHTREEQKIQREDFMDLLIKLKNKDHIEHDKTDEDLKNYSDHEVSNLKDLFEFEGDWLVAQAAIFFTAGFESNASTTSFTLYHLAMKPHIQDKLRAEIQDTLSKNNGQVTYDVVRTMPYLHMVVSETIRKYPPLSILDRVANVDYKIPGTDIVLEKGTPIYIPLLGIHNDPKVWDNPEDYDPERFNEKNKRGRHPFMYLPFGEGPKFCIGKNFGLLAVKVGLVNVLSRFEVSPCEDTPKSLKLNPRAMILAPEGGIPLKFSRIKA